ncbi:PREDICTED: uncharacterized protein LOC105972586 [Erythranthe guttata]|uniref:uncharacterized protein LOC105972586 n=1 Tax=Erythranthe guttata TaxID=4155 RepID=UPI00064DD025|nr:PREDICTED: uncharacterized protein LOC105972586 [Erythranthe guttata]|eukprot:XP_012853005.1 PREDICTED: uncharacterized protein LOC105972586 [Erythranthe guttata]
MNPTDAFVEEITEIEFNRNEEERTQVREDGIVENNHETLTGQIEKLDEMKADGALDKTRKQKKRQFEDRLNHVTKKTKVYLEPFEEFDCSEYFVRNEAFDSKEELKEWAKSIGRDHDMFLITQSTSRGKITITCERYGKARNKSNIDVESTKFKGSKKCRCPFALSGRKKKNGLWKLSISNGKHNHPLKIYGHSFGHGLSPEQYETVAALIMNRVKPKEILDSLRQENPGIRTSMKDIYNAVNKFKAETIGLKTIMQQFLHCIQENKYVKWHRADPSTDQIMDIMFAHRQSIELLKLFPYVLLMNSTHKINKYKMCLLEIIGVTPVGKYFNVAVAFLRNESEEHYEWALGNLRSLFDNGVGPGVIVTHRESSLMKALDYVFPRTYHLLCLAHINENVQLNARKFMGSKELGDEFTCGEWKKLVNSQSLHEFETNHAQILRDHQSNALLLTYLKETWLVYKDRFVDAWTNQVMHFGNTKMNTYFLNCTLLHSSLKMWLGSSTDKFDNVWKQVDSQFECQINEILSELAKSSKIQERVVTYPCFRNLEGVVVQEALSMMYKEHRVGHSRESCKCALRLTHGLPCAHEIAEKERDGDAFDGEDVHSFWRTMSTDALSSIDFQSDHNEEVRDKELRARLVGLVEELLLLPINEQKEILKELYLCYKPTSQPKKNLPARSSSGSRGHSLSLALLTAPQEKTSTKFDFTGFIPPFVVPSILSWVDVIGDGNCGYRCVAEVVMGSQDHWMKVRKALFMELSDRFEMYTKVYGGGAEGEQYVASMMSSLCHWTDTSAPVERWMTLSDMGLVIATHYNVMVLELSSRQNLTHLPLVSPDGAGQLSSVVGIGYEATAKHFVLLRVSDECPVPPFNPQWRRYKQPSVAYLENLFARRCRMWELLSAAM